MSTLGVRLAWPDSIRALAVVAVVLFHFLIFNRPEAVGGSGALDEAWHDVETILGRLRMPVLLAIAGMLGAEGIKRGWARGTAVRRAVSNYYLYVLWLVIYFVFYVTVSRPGLPLAVSSPRDFLTQLLIPDTTLWFLLALAVFPLVVGIMNSLRTPALVAIAIAVAIWWFGTYGTMPSTLGKLPRTFIYFAVGVYGADLLRKLSSVSWLRAIVLLVAFIGATQLIEIQDIIDAHLAILITNILAIATSVALVPCVIKWKVLAKFGTFVGSRTAPIYLLHIPLLAVLSLLTANSSVWTDGFRSWLGDLLLPVVSVAFIVGLSIGMGELLKRIPGNPFFTLPPMLAHRLGFSDQSPSSARHSGTRK